MLPHLLEAGPALAGPDSALQRAALVEAVPQGAFGRMALRVPSRLLWDLWADPTADPAVDPAVELLSTGLRVVGGGPRAVLVVGPDRTRRRQAALRALGASYCLATSAPSDPAGWAALVREATLSGTAILVEASEPPDAEGRRWIERSTHLSWALSSPTRLPLEDLPRRDWREHAAAEDDPDQDEWTHVLGPDVPRLHHLTAEQLDRMRLAMAATSGDAAAAYRRLTSARLDVLAHHIRPRATWDDLVLSPARKGVLTDLVDRYHHGTRVYEEWGFEAKPSRGLVALFAGQSGTGKTLAAEVVAGQLGLDLYRLDLSSVVSKYIGETEKNLDALFDAASLGNIVLFFDEADALFGKRSEISDAHDRYANVETSYLLQRLEQYDGIVVLATNYEKNIDRAFLRRVHVRVDFPMPGEPERQAIWERNLRPDAPYADDIDVPWLVERFDITGAAIRNAVVDAAFLAAAEDGPIHMRHLVRGVAREMHKLGRMVTAQVFGIWYDAAVTTTDAPEVPEVPGDQPDPGGRA
jgi:AAA+ superfamily predicted ATPase